MGDLLRNKSAYESDDEKAEEENEEEDEENGERGRGRMLGFMFGNVDDAGDLDEEYLDQVPTAFSRTINAVPLRFPLCVSACWDFGLGYETCSKPAFNERTESLEPSHTPECLGLFDLGNQATTDCRNSSLDLRELIHVALAAPGA